jgi:anti-sigma B factor antagonist
VIEPLGITIRQDGPRTLVVVEGEIDMASAPQLERALVAVDEGDIVVDLAGVAFLDSAGIATLVRAQRAVAARGNQLTTTGEQSLVRHALEVTGLFDVLHPDGADS